MIEFVRMTNAEFEEYSTFTIPRYAADKVRSGNWSKERALQRSQEEFTHLLPQGLNTPNHHFLVLKMDHLPNRVGWLWLMVEYGHAYIYDIFIEEAYRRQGYGQQAMELAEKKAKHLGATQIGLHVFGFNHAAQALYEKLGYETTNLNMSKSI